MKYLLLTLLLCSCARAPKLSNEYSTIHKAHDLNVVNLQDQACSNALNYSLNYFRSIGHPIRLTHEADKVLICEDNLELAYGPKLKRVRKRFKRKIRNLRERCGNKEGK